MAKAQKPNLFPVNDVDWNDEIADDLKPDVFEKLVVYSRDWTVETMISQVVKNNIDIDPDFQRRNAWNDLKRSMLIESLILNIPVPEIVLAVDPQNAKSFLVIDGKQRLLAILGFYDPTTYQSWDKPNLSGLRIRKDLNGNAYSDIKDTDDETLFLNADIRCAVISSYQDDDVLYHIFYRLNTGSVPLSTQELRQSLNKGPFSKFLSASTNMLRPIHTVLGLDEPDNRLRDAEILLRFISFNLFADYYKGNLKKFLDDSTKRLNTEWPQRENSIVLLSQKFDEATNRVLDVLGSNVGRKYNGATERWEGRFNKALFEAQVYFFNLLPKDVLIEKNNDAFEAGLKVLLNDPEFLDTIGATAKTPDRYRNRFRAICEVVETAYGVKLPQPAF